MRNKTIMSVMLILMVASVNALYGGEAIIIDLPNTEPVHYNVTGNSSNLEGLTAYQNESKFIISIAENMYPDSFTITIYKNGTEEVIEEVDTNEYSYGGTVRRTEINNETSNETIINETTIIEDIVSNETITEPVEEPKGALFFTIVIAIIGIGFIIFLFWLIFRKKPEDPIDYYDPNQLNIQGG